MKKEDQPNNIVPVDLTTGEIVSGRVITPAMEQEIKKKKKVQEQYKDYEQFYWLFYEMQQQLFEGKIEGAIAARLMFLVTFMGYHENKLAYRNGKLIPKKDLIHILNLSKKQYYDFIRICAGNNLLFIHDDDSISLTDKYFKRGKLYKKDLNNETSIIRVYCKTVQYLYTNSTPTYHKNLGYLFALIPHVNKQYNIVCSNPLETNFDKVIPLNLKELCIAIGFNPEHANDLKSHLKSIRIRNKPVISFVENCNGIKTFTNPIVYYSGNDYEKVKILGKF